MNLFEDITVILESLDIIYLFIYLWATTRYKKIH